MSLPLTSGMNVTESTPMTETTTQLDTILASPLSMAVIIGPVLLLLATIAVGCLIWWRKRKRRRLNETSKSNNKSAVANSSAISVPNAAFVVSSARPQYDVVPQDEPSNKNHLSQQQQQHGNMAHLRPMSGQFTPVALQRPLSGQMQPMFNARSLAQSAPVASSQPSPSLKYTQLGRESAAPDLAVAAAAAAVADDGGDVNAPSGYTSLHPAAAQQQQPAVGYSSLPPDAAILYSQLPETQQQNRY
jgi:hypothetical protein